MQPAPFPTDEAERIATLRQLLILDTLPEARFDNLTRVAASFFRVPVALVSLVDVERQWFKSSFGLAARETSRDVSFCAHAILREDVLVVEDALDDTRFADNPLVIDDPHIRFYAGAPLRMANGQQVGTLCVIDRAPRQVTRAEIDMLTDLARLVAQELEAMPTPADQGR